MELNVVNIVAMASFDGVRFDDLRQTLREHDVLIENRSPWLSSRWPPANFYASFYKSGKVLTPGARSEKVVRDRFTLIETRLKEWGLAPKIGKPVVQNMVTMGRVNLRKGLEYVLRSDMPGYAAAYEPEQFPALHLAREDCTFLLYASGSFVLTGVRDLETAQGLAERLEMDLGAVGAL